MSDKLQFVDSLLMAPVHLWLAFPRRQTKFSGHLYVFSDWRTILRSTFSKVGLESPASETPALASSQSSGATNRPVSARLSKNTPIIRNSVVGLSWSQRQNLGTSLDLHHRGEL